MSVMARIECVIITLLLSAVAIHAAEDDRFRGGSYDGWDRAEGTFLYSLLLGQPVWGTDDSVSKITAGGAEAGCTLLGTNAQAYLFWGTDNASTNWTWANTNFFGDPLSIGRVDGVAIGNLTADTKYYYIFYATNS